MAKKALNVSTHNCSLLPEEQTQSSREVLFAVAVMTTTNAALNAVYQVRSHLLKHKFNGAFLMHYQLQ